MAKVNRRSPWDEDGQPRAQEAVVSSKSVPSITTLVAPKEPAASRRINFDVTDDLHRRIRVKAAGEGLTVAEVGRQLLEAWVSSTKA